MRIVAVVFVGLVVAGAWLAWPKLLDLRYRLQLVEQRQASFGAMLATNLETYQAERGDAALPVENESPFARGEWRRIGDWEEWEKTKGLGVWRGDLYVGLYGPQAEVWRYNGADWTRVGQWPEMVNVHALAPHGDVLVASVDDKVLAYDGEWSDLGFPVALTTYGLASHQGTLYVSTIGETRVLAYDGEWREVSAGLPSVGFSGVYELWPHNGALYAGLIAEHGATLVYRLAGERWEVVGGRGINGSWISDGATYALSFASVDDQLIVTTNRQPMTPGPLSSIWAFDGAEWHPVGASSVPGIWGEMDNYNASLGYRGRLVSGAGGMPPGNASVWELSADGWREVGGHGVNGSWGPDRLSDSRDPLREYVYRLIEWRGNLVVGFGALPGAAQVWMYTPEP